MPTETGRHSTARYLLQALVLQVLLVISEVESTRKKRRIPRAWDETRE